LLLPAAPFLFGDTMAALVNLTDYKIYKKITKTDADVELQYIIDSVNTLVRTFVGHSIIDYYTTPYEETFNVSQGQSALQLKEWPIRAVSKVETREDYDKPYVIMSTAEYHVDTSVDCIFLHGKSTYWPEGFGAVKVIYTAGYATVPLDLRMACLDLVHMYAKEEYKEKRAIGNTSIDNSTTRGASLATEWPIHIVRILNMYRNV
jgi:hypothetical protein